MSLRELPPEQKITTRRWRRLRYVPLTILVVCAAVAGIAGATLAPSHPANRDVTAKPAPLKSATSAASALPDVCHPDVAPPPQQPWLGSDSSRAAAEAVWAQHATELSQPYIKEKDGWVDWGDVQASNFSVAVGRRFLTTDEASRWHDYLTGIKKGLAAQGIPFYVLVAPAKWDVYPEKLPGWAQSLRGSNALDQLLARYPDLPIIDVRAALRNAKKGHAVYAPLNPHWTNYGGLVAWNAVANCLRAASPTLGDLRAPPSSGVGLEADRNEFADYGFTDSSQDWTVPSYDPELSPVQITDSKGTRTVPGTQEIDMLDLPLTTRVETSGTSSTALIARDSFGNAFNIPADQEFATTWQVRHNLDGAVKTQPDLVALATKDHPDVVILEVTERYLSLVPPVGTP